MNKMKALRAEQRQKNHDKQKPDTALRGDSACRGFDFLFLSNKIRTSEVGTIF